MPAAAISAIIAAVAALGSAVAGGVRAYKGREAQANADKMYQKYLKALNAIPMPPLQYESLISLGLDKIKTYVPEYLPSSSLENVKDDPSLLQHQYDALNKLAERTKTGFTAGEKAQRELAQQNAFMMGKAQKQATDLNFAQKGTALGGAARASQAFLDQNTNVQLSNIGKQTAADAENRALDASIGAASLAGQMNESKYAKEADKAKTRDAIAMFNTNNLNQAKLQETNDRFTMANMKMKLAQHNSDQANNRYALEANRLGANLPLIQREYNQADADKVAAGGYLSNAFEGMSDVGAYIGRSAQENDWAGAWDNWKLGRSIKKYNATDPQA